MRNGADVGISVGSLVDVIFMDMYCDFDIHCFFWSLNWREKFWIHFQLSGFSLRCLFSALGSLSARAQGKGCYRLARISDRVFAHTRRGHSSMKDLHLLIVSDKNDRQENFSCK